jgi:hypothetical protein
LTDVTVAVLLSQIGEEPDGKCALSEACDAALPQGFLILGADSCGAG